MLPQIVIVLILMLLCTGQLLVSANDPVLPYCKTDIEHDFEHITGTWKPIEQEHRLFTCCGTNDNPRSPVCAVENSDFIHAPYLGYQNHCCTCQADLKSFDAPLDAEMYEWTPSTCQLASFMKGDYDFCEILGDRQITIIGDSTMPHVVYTLNAMIYTAFKAGKLKRNCASQINYILNHVWHTAHDAEKRDDFSDLLTRLYHNPVDIIIASIGAHIHESPYFGALNSTDEHADMPHGKYLRAWKRHIQDMEWLFEQQSVFLKDKFPNKAPPQWFYMTAQPGIVNCADMTEPLVDRDRGEGRYQYQSIHSMNDYARVHFKGTGVGVIDTTPLQLRPDAKVKQHDHTGMDCLHFCVPGPLNFVAELIGHVLYTKWYSDLQTSWTSESD